MGAIFLSPEIMCTHHGTVIPRHSSGVLKQSLLDGYFLLKGGVTLARQRAGEDSYRLGLPTHGVLIKSGLQVQIARSLDGKSSLTEIAHGLKCETKELSDFVELLRGQGFIEEHARSKEPPQQDISVQLIALRETTERSLLTHRSGVDDGGAGELFARQSATILISGENRLAHNLLAALLASGFTHTRLISRRVMPVRLTGEDVCGIAVRTGDIGKVRKEFNEEVARSSRISKGELLPKSRPDLIISTIPIEWDYVQRWMSEGSAHLHINPLIGPEVEIGPFVLPGVSACLRCVTLIKRDNGTSVEQEFVRKELPSAAIAYLSGLISLAVGEYFATGASPLVAASYWYDLLLPMRAPEIRHWNFHSDCGCQY